MEQENAMPVTDWISHRVFNLVHRNNLIYNTCWEDPRLDRAALELGSDDDVLVITSAGCNALDYALAGARRVFAVDLNPRQNALLELKLAALRTLEFDDFFAMFGRGRLPRVTVLYRQRLRGLLGNASRSFWDRRIAFFDEDNRRGSFYFHGTCGSFARAMNIYIDRIARLRPWVDAILEAGDVRQQRAIFDRHLRDRFWSGPLRFALRRDAVLSLVGVPKAQRRQVDTQYGGGLIRFIEDCLEAVFARLSLADNYFWRVYLTGQYSLDCCPEYLKEANFERLRGGLADRVGVHTDSVEGFLRKHAEPISRFVLLDHMDWLSGRDFPLLESEWQAILDRATPGARLIWRSGGLQTDFVDGARVVFQGHACRVGELLRYHREFAHYLHQQCRVHTYGSFHIAELAA